jgi:mevalonate kinase
MTKKASAPAKIILFGEHAVVYEQPAIAVPISSVRATATIQANEEPGLHINALDLNRKFPVNLERTVVDDALTTLARITLQKLEINPPNATIAIRSDIPMASGLGSGAAVSACLARAIAMASEVTIDLGTLNNIVYEVEKIYHNTPSGIDNTVVVYEKAVYFVRNQPIETLTIGRPFTVVVGDTGKTALTKIAVDDVSTLFNANPDEIQVVFDAIGQISRAARRAIENGDIEALGPLMTTNHEYLQKLTVSSPELDELVHAAMKSGALGAKLSGSGRGGNMIALVKPGNDPETTKRALLDAGATRVFVSNID